MGRKLFKVMTIFLVILILGGLIVAKPALRYLTNYAEADPAEKALIAAINKNHPDRIIALLKNGKSPNGKIPTTTGGMPVLYYAVIMSKCDVVAVLAQNRADLNVPWGPAQRTALHEAALNGNIPCVKALLETGADPNFRNTFGRTALAYATNPALPLSPPPNSAEVAELLRSYGGKE